MASLANPPKAKCSYFDRLSFICSPTFDQHIAFDLKVLTFDSAVGTGRKLTRLFRHAQSACRGVIADRSARKFDRACDLSQASAGKSARVCLVPVPALTPKMEGAGFMAITAIHSAVSHSISDDDTAAVLMPQE